MTQGERIKELRKKLGLTQEEFGDKLGVVKSAISGVENDSRSLTNQMSRAICREFHVNETWLRSGEGEMMSKPTRDEQIAAFADGIQALGDGAFKRRFVAMLSALGEREWETLEKMARDLADEPDQPDTGEMTIDEKVELYRSELEREKKAGKKYEAS